MKKILNKFKTIYKMDKKVIKFDGTEIEEQKFHHKKISFSINDVDVNETAVSNKLPLVKKILNISLVTNILKKLDLYAYSTHK